MLINKLLDDGLFLLYRFRKGRNIEIKLKMTIKECYKK